MPEELYYYRCVDCGNVRAVNGVRFNGVTTGHEVSQEEATAAVLMGKVIYRDRCGRCVARKLEKEEQHA